MAFDSECYGGGRRGCMLINFPNGDPHTKKAKRQHQFQVLKLSNRVEYANVTRYSVKGVEKGVKS